jgi:hypothetical protein
VNLADLAAFIPGCNVRASSKDLVTQAVKSRGRIAKTHRMNKFGSFMASGKSSLALAHLPKYFVQILRGLVALRKSGIWISNTMMNRIAV